MGRKGKEPNALERGFIRHYVAGEPGVRGQLQASAVAAGASPKDTGAGAKLMARPLVRAEKVLREIGRVAFSDMQDYAKWRPDGVTLEASDGLPDDAATAVAEVSEHETTGEKSSSRTLRFKLHDQNAALTTPAKHLKIIGNGHAEGAGRVAVIILGAGGQPLDIDAIRERALAQRVLADAG